MKSRIHCMFKFCGHIIGRRTYLQYIMIAPCSHTSCFILKWTCLISTTAVEFTHQKANDIGWTKPWCCCCY